MSPTQHDIDLFWAKVDKRGADECWEWLAAVKGHGGHGAFKYGGRRGGKSVIAHRFAWELVHGPVSAGMYVMHSCPSRTCVNVAHLFVGKSNPIHPPKRQPLTERFWARVVKSPGCWEWSGRRDEFGYGQIEVNNRHCKAHRIAYELLVGPIPVGLVLDHLCRNPPCVNPAHLEPVTNKENILRGYGRAAIQARQTHCKRGHEFTPENTYRNSGHRYCRACSRLLWVPRSQRVGKTPNPESAA